MHKKIAESSNKSENTSLNEPIWDILKGKNVSAFPMFIPFSLKETNDISNICTPDSIIQSKYLVCDLQVRSKSYNDIMAYISGENIVNVLFPGKHVSFKAKEAVKDFFICEFDAIYLFVKADNFVSVYKVQLNGAVDEFCTINQDFYEFTQEKKGYTVYCCLDVEKHTQLFAFDLENDVFNYRLVYAYEQDQKGADTKRIFCIEDQVYFRTNDALYNQQGALSCYSGSEVYMVNGEYVVCEVSRRNKKTLKLSNSQNGDQVFINKGMKSLVHKNMIVFWNDKKIMFVKVEDERIELVNVINIFLKDHIVHEVEITIRSNGLDIILFVRHDDKCERAFYPIEHKIGFPILLDPSLNNLLRFSRNNICPPENKMENSEKVNKSDEITIESDNKEEDVDGKVFVETIKNSRDSHKDGYKGTGTESVKSSSDSIKDGDKRTGKEIVKSSNDSLKDGGKRTGKEMVKSSNDSLKGAIKITGAESTKSRSDLLKEEKDAYKRTGTESTKSRSDLLKEEKDAYKRTGAESTKLRSDLLKETGEATNNTASDSREMLVDLKKELQKFCIKVEEDRIQAEQENKQKFKKLLETVSTHLNEKLVSVVEGTIKREVKTGIMQIKKAISDGICNIENKNHEIVEGLMRYDPKNQGKMFEPNDLVLAFQAVFTERLLPAVESCFEEIRLQMIEEIQKQASASSSATGITISLKDELISMLHEGKIQEASLLAMDCDEDIFLFYAENMTCPFIEKLDCSLQNDLLRKSMSIYEQHDSDALVKFMCNVLMSYEFYDLAFNKQKEIACILDEMQNFEWDDKHNINLIIKMQKNQLTKILNKRK